MTIPDLPDAQASAVFPRGFGPRFIVTIDTEEEFDWDSPFSREGHGFASVPAIARFQEFCEAHGVIPAWLVDYPITTCPQAVEILGPTVAAGKAELGIHLHPWVNPPFDEEVCDTNSFAGNLPKKLESAKLSRLNQAIRENFGVSALIYRAGRYGAGPDTARILKDNGVVIDSSVRTHFNYSPGSGPDFARHPLLPYWIDSERSLLELPLTTVYHGALGCFGTAMFPRIGRLPTLRGLFARSGVLERIPLTPEGVTVAEAIRGIDTALAKGLPLLVFSFHSPSLGIGHTPYVRCERDLEAFYAWWRAVFDHLSKRNVAPSSVGEIARAVSLA